MITDMGLMNKLNKMKSFLFDEEEEEKEIKKTSAKKEKIEDKKERIMEDSYEVQDKEEDFIFEDVSEEPVMSTPEVHSRVEKTEQKFNFPEFDDDDFMVASKKPEPIIPTMQEEPKRILYQGSKRKEETKKFKPSPIISPIYGLLDSEGNSKKDDTYLDKSSSYNDEVTFDEVRKKAYGSIDDEIEDTMKRLSTKTIEEAEKEMENAEKELSREKKKSSKVKESAPIVVDMKNEEDDDDDDMILPNVNFKEIDVDVEKEKTSLSKKSIKEEDDDDDDDTKEQDLFNLIDTMYQNKEGEE